MNRSGIGSRDEERKEIDKASTQTTKVFIEADTEILTKLCNGEPYEKDDVRKTAELLLTQYDYDVKEQLQVFENVEDFSEKLIKGQKPIFFIYSKSENCWVLFCFLHKENTKKVLYKDSSGCGIGQKLEAFLRTKVVGLDIVDNTEKSHGEDEEYYYGPICLRNLKIFLDSIKEDLQKFENKFLDKKFCKVADLNDVKLWNVIKVINEISENEDFKKSLKQFVDNIPSMDFTDEYNKILEEESTKEEINYEKIKEIRKKCFSEKNLKKITDSFEVFKEENENEIDYKFDIQKKFPLEMEKLQKVLTILSKTEVDDKLYSALNNLCEILDIDADKLKSYFKPQKKVETNHEDKLKPKSFDDIKQNLPEMKTPTPDPCTPFSQLMEEMRLGMDSGLSDYNSNKEMAQSCEQQDKGNVEALTEKKSQPPIQQVEKENLENPSEETSSLSNEQEDKKNIQASSEKMSQPSNLSDEEEKIAEKYNLVKSKYALWENKTLDEIREWAIAIKGHLTNSDDHICEAIAIMDRAFNLLTGGFHLRDTQILAALIFLHSQKEQGRLCQIQTGEGKTNIVSLLAVVKALQGLKVDVITSNPLLADDGVKETQTFYSVFNLTVSTNNPSQDGQSKIGYTADVLYGTISNFQFDYLKDSFEGYNIRRERPFGQVILDEVDSMLVDNGGHIAKLASPFPGMECLRYIYIKIWQALYRAEEEFIAESEDRLKQFLKGSPSEEKYEEFIQEITDSERKIIKEKIKASNPINVPLVPYHLQEYVKSKLDIWIKNALHAKYNCHEHQQYRIITNDSGEKVIAPVDYLNTGVTMKNTIWSNGLHQFVQLKHNLYLTFESLTSSFISNIGYIKNYEDKNIFGLTGTLGSRAEQQLLAHIYNVDYAKLPTFKEKKFEELDGVVANDGSWSIQTTMEILKKIDEKRAVLSIFETEQDLLTISENLEALKSDDFRIRTFANEDNAKETGEKVKIGDIILATNIAGRGTNFRTEKSLEENGGLHVLVGFLPCNKRVEDQAFGRTSRQGNSGTAQLVIRQSEVDELEINENADFKQIKKERDNLERTRLEDIKNVLVKELNFKDDLFKKFSEFYRTWRKNKYCREDEFVANDLKEFWAFWLDKKNYNIKNIEKVNVDGEFKCFQKEASKIIKNWTINHNPFYSIGLANIHLENEDTAEAKKELKHAIAVGGNKDELLGGANLKLFEVAVLEGEQFKHRFKEAIGKCFFISVNDTEEYKEEATKYLNKAKVSIQRELQYFREQFLIENDGGVNEEMMNILVESENILWTHLNSRYVSLEIHKSNIDTLLEEFKDHSVQLDIGGKVPTYVENLKEVNDDLSKSLTNYELSELHSIGLEALYGLKKVPDVPDVIIHAAQGEILAGIALLVAGLFFPPIFPIMSGTAADLISGAIIDIVMAIIVPEEVDPLDYMKGKFISYGKSLLSLGISAAKQCVKILQKAINFCRKISRFLREANKFKKACEKLADLVDKLQEYLKKLLMVAEFNKLSKADQLTKMKELKQMGNELDFNKLGGPKKFKALTDSVKDGKLGELSRPKLVSNFMKNTVTKTTKNVTKSIVANKIIKPLVDRAFGSLISSILEKIKESFKQSVKKRKSLVEKLKTAKREDIDAAVKEFIKMNVVEKQFVSVAPTLLKSLKGKLGASKTEILSISIVAGIDFSELIRYGTTFASKLEEKLTGGKCSNDVEKVIDEVCIKIANEVLDVIEKILTQGKDMVGVVSGDIIPSRDGKNFYSVLGLKAGASVKEVRDRFRKLVLESSVDKSLNDEKFEQLRAAYQGITGI